MKKIVLEISDCDYDLLERAASIAGVSFNDLCLACFYHGSESFKTAFDFIKSTILIKKS